MCREYKVQPRPDDTCAQSEVNRDYGIGLAGPGQQMWPPERKGGHIQSTSKPCSLQLAGIEASSRRLVAVVTREGVQG